MVFGFIKDYYGYSTYKILCICFKTSNKIIHLQSQKVFLQRCKRSNIVPPSFKVKPLVMSSNGSKIARATSFKFMAAAVSLIYGKLKSERYKLHYQFQALFNIIADNDKLLVLKFLKNSNVSVRSKTEARLRAKYDRLLVQDLHVQERSSSSYEWVMNLSSKKLSNSELNILNRGMGYSLGSSKINIPRILSAIEPAIDKLDDKSKHSVRSDIAKLLLHSKKNNSLYHCNKYSAILKSLSNDPSVIFTRADKSRLIVILDKSTYIEKSLELLNDTSTYSQLNKDLTPSIQRNLNKLIVKCVHNNTITSDSAKSLKCYTGLVPNFYGLPKTHKPGTPLRPIIDYSRSPLYNLAKYLSSLLKPLTQNSLFSLSSSYQFINDLNDFISPPNVYMVSLDVVSLFTSIPIQYVCDVIKEIYPSICVSDSMYIDSVIELVSFCLYSNCFKFNDSYYKQIKGTPMGSPASVVIAEIVMQYIENKINIALHNKIFFWRRFVDDVFLIANKDDLNEIITFSNSICPDIQFTLDPEVNMRLPFLDVLVERVDNINSSKFVTSVYRKPTFSGQYLNFNSSNPKSHKIAVFRGLVQRAYKFSSNDSLFKREIRRIFQDLIKNDYPLNWLKRIYREKINPSLTELSKTSHSSAKLDKYFISIPYFGPPSEKIARILRPYNISTAFKPVCILRNRLFNFKPKLPPFDSIGVIYNIPCKNCDAVYIGETKRTGNIRLKEHKIAFKNKDPRSKLVMHAIDFDHIPDFENSKILSLNQINYKSRIFLEGWYTANQSHTLNEACAVPKEYSIFVQ